MGRKKISKEIGMVKLLRNANLKAMIPTDMSTIPTMQVEFRRKKLCKYEKRIAQTVRMLYTHLYY
jgi:hypothetical protein